MGRILWLSLLVLTLGIGGTTAQAQDANEASHTVKIKVEETNQLKLGDGPSLTLDQGGGGRSTSTYTVRTNQSADKSISASAKIEDPPSGLTLQAEMQAPEASGTSAGPQKLLENGQTPTRTLISGMGTVSKSGLRITYEASSTTEVPPGEYSVTVTYTIVGK